MKSLVMAAGLLLAAAAQAQDTGRYAAVSAYFELHNAGLAETPFSGNTPRQFSWVRKVTACDRDGWKCVACGATNHLEMDHAVALMNGGSNDLTNLFTLCHDCHVEKTRMDRSLKKHRVKLVQAAPAPP